MNEQIEEMAKAMCGNAMPNGNCATDDEPCFLECVYGYCAERLYQKDYRKQSEVIEEYRQKVNTKMGKHTHLLGKEYVQRILREVAKEMKGGAE